MGHGVFRLDAIRPIGHVEQIYGRWRNPYHGMAVDQLKARKRLQQENERLRHAVSDLFLLRGCPLSSVQATPRLPSSLNQ